MFRFETIAIAVLLGSPVAALWLRGDFTDADVWWRFGLCWLAAWVAVTLVSVAARPLAIADSENDAEGDNDPAEDPGDAPTEAPAVADGPAAGTGATS